MTSNQIEYAKHLENVRHNKITESQGWHTAESSRISATGTYNRGQASLQDAQTHRDTIPINWYTAETSRIDSNTRRYDAETNARNADTNARNATTREKELQNQIVNTLGQLNNKRVELEIARRNSNTNRGNMWFTAINNAVGNTLSAGKILSTLVN